MKLTTASSALAISFLASIAAASDDFRFPHPLRPIPSPQGCGANGEVECPACDAAPRDCHQRVRRSWSTLTDQHKQKFVWAMHNIKYTSTELGRELYGPDFVNYNEFILQHAAGVADPRGDQAHLDQHFSLFHRMLILRFENTLLSVAPELQGLPYWDIRDGVDSIFGPGPLQFGSTTGTGPNHEVEDGAFAGWTVATYADYQQAGDAVPIFEEHKDTIFSNVTGDLLLRSSDVPTTSIVRYPACTDDVPGPLKYTPENYEACISQPTFEDFYWCLESPTENAAHELVHFWLGGADDDNNQYGFACPKFAPPNLKREDVRQGDYIDKLTSPNDPIFFLHHAFVDMLSMDFMRSHPNDADHYWGFKASADNDSMVTPGTLLEDEIGGGSWPFTGAEVLLDADETGAPQSGLTYAEAMCWVGPETAIYTYDQFTMTGDVVCGDGDLPEEETIPTEPLPIGDVFDMEMMMPSSAYSMASTALAGLTVLLVFLQ